MNSEEKEEFVVQEFFFTYNKGCANIISCYTLYKFDSKFAILEELMWGTVGGFIRLKRSYSENLIGYIIKEVTTGLSCTHNNHIIHRDLKSENVFFSFDGRVKIGDFGLSAQLTVESKLRNTCSGSPLYMAPEVLDNISYSISCDIWSLGILCYELANGFTPYHHCQSEYELRRFIRTSPEPKIDKKFSQSFQDFLSFCLQKLPSFRKTCPELLDSDFLRNIDISAAVSELTEIIFK